MKQRLILLFAILSYNVLAQQKEVNYTFLKPYFSKNHSQSFTIGLSNDSLYSSVWLYSTENKPMDVQHKLFPFLILEHADSLFYIHQRTVSYNESLEEVYEEGDTTRINFYQYQSTPVILRTIKEAMAQSAYDARNQEPPPPITDDMNHWDVTQINQIEYILPHHIQVSAMYDGYMGGAHPNHFTERSVKTIDNFLYVQQHPEEDIQPTETATSFINVLRPMNLDSVKRVLYFKGVAGCFDDMFDETPCKFNLNDYAGKSINDVPDADHTVNTDYVNALLERKPGYFDVLAEAYAEAHYAESGDYQFTASCRVGVLPLSFFPFTNPTLDIDLIRRVDPNVQDYYMAADASGLLLLRSINGTSQLRWIYDEGKKITDISLPENTRIIQLQWFSAPVNEQLLKEQQ